MSQVNPIITRGLGQGSMIVTQGYGQIEQPQPQPTSKIYIISRLQGEVLSYEQWKTLTKDGKYLDVP